MILSFHPLFEGDRQRLCAGRMPDAEDLAAIKKASAVILPQGCTRRLWEMAVENCPNVFPDYRARYRFPGKLGQILLFRKFDIPHPRSIIFESLDKMYAATQDPLSAPPMAYPFVFKFDWGGEGDTVTLITGPDDFKRTIATAAIAEKSGSRGFLIQRYIPSARHTLRVVVVGETLVSYWRKVSDKSGFYSNLNKGAVIDAHSDVPLQEAGKRAVESCCAKTGINLAGFDLIFDERFGICSSREPLFLEINYFFGRSGLGGSDAYYALLKKEIDRWLAKTG